MLFSVLLLVMILSLSERENVREGNAFCYLYWAAAGPSCTGTRHRTPAVWQTRYRSSAFAHTGRSWRATSYDLWKEGRSGGGETYRSGSVTQPVIQCSTKCSSRAATTAAQKKARLKWALMDFCARFRSHTSHISFYLWNQYSIRSRHSMQPWCVYFYPSLNLQVHWEQLLTTRACLAVYF